MTLQLTPEMLAAAYDFLRTTPPFTGWRLPESDDVVFRLSLRPKEFGRYQWDGEHHTITMSIKAIAHTDTLMRYMAHEMVHLSLEKDGLESKTGGEEVHNAEFRKRAARVCKYHGFDPKAFY